MKYMIHACPDRMWYVNGFLIPSMLDQGITRDEIIVWNDAAGNGNLIACMEAFSSCRWREGGTWHLQDDVLISRDFAERTREQAGDKVVCGFCYSGYEDGTPIVGNVFPVLMWRSTFPCVYIPNSLAAECADWFFTDAMHRQQFEPWVKSGKKDDNFFHAFCIEQHPNEFVVNLAPHLVEHVDYIIGGSTINKWRGYIARGYYFDDETLVTELTEKVVKLKSNREATTLKA